MKIEKRIIDGNFEQGVDARDLWLKLKSKRQFGDWIKTRLARLKENADFQTYSRNREKLGRPSIEYFLTLDAAKGICMLEDNDVGDKIRQYFIKIEKQVTAKPTINTLAKHTSINVQIQNSKNINSTNSRNGGVAKIQDYNRQNCKIHTNLYPHEIVNHGKNIGLKSKDYSSAKAVLRIINPEIASAMSLADELVCQGKDINEVSSITKKVIPIYKEIMNIGIIPKELSIIE